MVPQKGSTHEHVFNDDGSVEWNCLDGPQKGQAAREREYAAVRVADDLSVVYALSVVLNFHDLKLAGFASSAQEWFPCKGIFEFVM
jgi:hypothetical protein